MSKPKIKIHKDLLAIQKSINGKVKGAIVTGVSYEPIQCYSTGVKTLDKELGGGLPKGKIVEIYGLESSGKTTLMIGSIAAVQAAHKDNLAAFIDVEHALDIDWAVRNGVDQSRLAVSQPNNGEEVFKIIEELIQYENIKIIVVDSVPSLQPQESIDKMEKDGEDNTMGAQARLMSKGLRSLNNKLATTKTSACIVFVNQVRQKLGVMFGNNETTPGGLALRFYTAIRMKISKKSTGDPNKPNANRREGAIFSNINIIKNKIAPPFKNCEIHIHAGSPVFEGGPKTYGIDLMTPLVASAVDFGVITVKGSNFYLGDQKLAVGKLKLYQFLTANKEVREAVSHQITACIEAMRSNQDETMQTVVDSPIDSEDEVDEKVIVGEDELDVSDLTELTTKATSEEAAVEE